MRRTPRSRMQPSPMSRRPADASANISADLSAEVSRISERDSIVSARSSLTVRVFGYPPDKAHAVVAYFQRLGNIAKRTMGSGNWLDIEYRDQDGFERARGMDGQQIDMHTMVGVKEVPRHEHTHNASRRFITTPSHRRKPQQRSGVAHLSKSFWSSFNPWLWWGGSSSNPGGGKPRPETLCEKIMEYIFQW